MHASDTLEPCHTSRWWTPSDFCSREHRSARSYRVVQSQLPASQQSNCKPKILALVSCVKIGEPIQTIRYRRKHGVCIRNPHGNIRPNDR